jgi:hypothetical protein
VSFFEVNLDYVYFLSGLALVSLGAAASLLVIERERSLRWLMLAVFGILAGLATWAATATIGLGDTPVFAWSRFVVRVLSLAALFEFGRSSLGRDRRAPGPWLTVVLAMAALGSASPRPMRRLGSLLAYPPRSPLRGRSSTPPRDSPVMNRASPGVREGCSFGWALRWPPTPYVSCRATASSSGGGQR